jgi:TonB family protein
MALRKLWLLAFAAAMPAICLASIQGPSLAGVQASLFTHEREVWTSAVHGSKFSPVPHTTARASCEATRAPEALATPNPVLDNPESDAKVTVSFIIGADGRVHSPLILESAGPSEDRTVLDTVRSWRYRPATCNGVPTEAEAKVEFSSW